MQRTAIHFDRLPTAVRLAGADGTATAPSVLSPPSPPPQAPVSQPTSTPDPVDPVPDLLRQIAHELQESEQARLASLEELQMASVELAVIVAGRIVRTAIDRDQFAVKELVAEAIAAVSQTDQLRVLLHPQDHELLQQQLADGQPTWPESVTISADSDMPRGGCRIDSPEGGLLSRIETHLADLRVVLLDDLDHAQIERRSPDDDGHALRRFPDRRRSA